MMFRSQLGLRKSMELFKNGDSWPKVVQIIKISMTIEPIYATIIL
jgi:hypothetical protein